MASFNIVDECLVPKRLAWLYYRGPDAVGFLRDIKGNLRFIFETSTTRVRERKLMWDYSGDPIRFYSEFWVVKEFSRFTEMWVSIRTLGYVSKGTQHGNWSLELYGDLRHKFEPSNWLLKYTWLLYNYLFYNKIRERYIIMCRDYIQKFLNWVKEKYNLRTVTTPEATLEELEEEKKIDEITHSKPQPPS